MRKLLSLAVFGLVVLCSTIAYSQCSCSRFMTVDWVNLSWNDGDLSNQYSLTAPGSIDFSFGIHVSTNASGSFANHGVRSPYKDGPGYSAHFFNTGLDLGVMFDPTQGQGQSPVYIDLSFESEVTCLTFVVSDIDEEINTTDQIVISGNSGRIRPSLFVVSRNPTVSISGITATALGGNSGSNRNGSASAGSDEGNIVVDFGNRAITDVRIEYREVSGKQNPPERGIGLFESLSFCPPALLPLTLIDFNVSDDNKDCLTEVKWRTADEQSIDHYQISFSEDGEVFKPIGRISPQPSQGIKEYIFQTITNVSGYFQLSEITIDGSITELRLSPFDPSCVKIENAQIYPNPISGPNVTWRLPAIEDQHTVQLDLIDMYGKEYLKNIPITLKNQKIDLVLPVLPKGIYLLSARIKGRYFQEKLMISS